MKAEVRYLGEPVGSLDWTNDAYGALVALDCALTGDPLALLRCYGQTADGGALLIGLPEPRQGRLRLERRLSRETLKAAGCEHTMPQEFYLALQPEDRAPAPPQKQEDPPEPLQAAQQPEHALETTGEPLLDALIRQGEVQCEMQEGDAVVSCPFAHDQPFALAPAFVLCSVEAGRAALRWSRTKKIPPGE